jgi:hypothetical protein
MNKGILLLFVEAIVLTCGFSRHTYAHDIYTGVRGKEGQLCCGDSDCFSTIYRERGEVFEFRKRDGNWVQIPQNQIIFLPVPGDRGDDFETHRAHLCYRQIPAGDYYSNAAKVHIFGDIYVFCAFIPPGRT